MADEPQVFAPVGAVTAIAPDGRRLIFFQVPQLDLMIKRVIAERPTQYTYRWAYHPGHKVHILLFGWPNGEGAGIALPEESGDPILQFMQEQTDVFITTLPVEERLKGDVPPSAIQEIIMGNTVGLPEIVFQPLA